MFIYVKTIDDQIKKKMSTGEFPQYNAKTFPYHAVRWVDAEGRQYVPFESWNDADWVEDLKQGILPFHVAIRPRGRFPSGNVVLKWKEGLDGRLMHEEIAQQIVSHVTRVSKLSEELAIQYKTVMLPPRVIQEIEIIVNECFSINSNELKEVGEVIVPAESTRPSTVTLASVKIVLCRIKLAPRSRGWSTFTYFLTPERFLLSEPIQYIIEQQQKQPRQPTTTKQQQNDNDIIEFNIPGQTSPVRMSRNDLYSQLKLTTPDTTNNKGQ
jgi:hypothetical protein